jgi:hypothetical protein
VSSDTLTAIGAFLSGAGSVLSAAWYVRAMRKRAAEECEKRLQAFRDGLHEMEHADEVADRRRHRAGG